MVAPMIAEKFFAFIATRADETTPSYLYETRLRGRFRRPSAFGCLT